MRVKQMMDPALKSIQYHATLRDALSAMVANGVRALVVKEKGRTAGIITDQDIGGWINRRSGQLSAVQVRDVMVSAVPSVYEHTDVVDARAQMEARHVRLMPVFNTEGGLAGFLAIEATYQDVDSH